jgi:threonine/homoserine/homoserine lactone efflux protein
MRTIWEFLVTCIIVEMTPGPNMAYLAGLALTRGRMAGIAAVAGVALGLTAIGLLAAVGLAEAVSRSPTAFAVLRWSGVVYLLWLAWEAWRDSASGVEAPLDAATLGGLFGRGLLTNVLNPKAAVFYIAILPAFIVPERPLIAQNLTLVVVYVGVATIIHTTIVIFAAQIGGWLKSGNGLRRTRRGLAISLLLVALWFLWQTRT